MRLRLLAALASGKLSTEDVRQDREVRRGRGAAWRIQLVALARLGPPFWHPEMAWPASQAQTHTLLVRLASLERENAQLRRQLAEHATRALPPPQRGKQRGSGAKN